MGDPLSLRGVLDIERIESVLRSFSDRLDQQQGQLSTLLRTTANCEQTCELLKSGVDRALVDVDRRLGQFEARFHRYDIQESRLDDIERSVEHLDRNQRNKADFNAVNELHSGMTAQVENIYVKMRDLEDQKEVMLRLDKSQRELAKQLATLQELLSCKVDRVEVPLIQNAGDRVKAADQFRLEAGPQLRAIQIKLEELQEQIDSKEERSAIVERMQAIYRELQNRPERGDVEGKIERPLEDLIERFHSFQSGISSLQPQAISESINQSRSELENLMNETRALKLQLDRINSQLNSRASVRLVEKKADKSYCEQLVQELALNCEEKLVTHSAVVDGLKKQILELKRIQNDVDGKLSVSLKFLDWFSTVQLEKQIGSRAL